MDKITEVLSTFFVAQEKERQKQVSEAKSSTKSDTDTDTYADSDTKTNAKTETKTNAKTETKSDTYAESETKSQTEEKWVSKRYVLKAVEFHKKRIVVFNKNMEDNISTVSNLLHSLSLMKDVGDIYDKYIHVVTAAENKSRYKKMLIDNPYLYFTDFDVRTDFKSFTKSDKRTIYIVDFYQFLEYDNFREFLDANVLLFLVVTGYNSFVEDAYGDDVLGTSKLIIHKKDRYKTEAREFFRRIVKPITKFDMDFNDYWRLAEDNSLVVLKGNELRFG